MASIPLEQLIELACELLHIGTEHSLNRTCEIGSGPRNPGHCGRYIQELVRHFLCSSLLRFGILSCLFSILFAPTVPLTCTPRSGCQVERMVMRHALTQQLCEFMNPGMIPSNPLPLSRVICWSMMRVICGLESLGNSI